MGEGAATPHLVKLTARQRAKMRQEAQDTERKRLRTLRDQILAHLADEGVSLGFYRTGEYDDCSGFITLESKHLETVYVSLEPEIDDA